ncbi:MAG TPA: hypothetical protein VNF03_19935 [Patescibacteria group bacterium]|jgi:hypothetical protein|nr:hypothetical protein [Patescibacteria group bacterium]
MRSTAKEGTAVKDLAARDGEAVTGGRTTTDGCASSTRPAPQKDPVNNPPTGGEPGHGVVISIIGVLIG